MQTKKAVQLNTILNISAIAFILIILLAGYLVYTNPQNAKEIYKNAFKLISPRENTKETYKTIEIRMYDQPTANIKNIAMGMQKKENEKILAEILNINTLQTQKITKILQTTKLTELNNTDITIEMKILTQEKNWENYFNNKKIALGDEFSIAFDNATVNGTIMRIA